MTDPNRGYTDPTEPTIPQQRGAGRRFDVALSFPGEKRDYVSQVASALRAQTSVFYDADHEAELAQPDLDLYLQNIYHNQADLVVVFFCADYDRKEWCGLEWRAIRDLIKKRESYRIMLMAFDDVDISGVFSIDGYVDLRRRTPKAAAHLICQRLNQLRGDPVPTSDAFRLEQENLIVRLSPLIATRTGIHLPNMPHTSDLEALPLEAWPRFLAIDSNYQERRARLLVSLINDDYEEATAQYWELLYYTGTRELWTDRAFLSQLLLELSERHKDHGTSGLILARGQAWPLIYKRRLREARKVLEKALAFSVRAKDRLGIAVFHEYMADVASISGKPPLANKLYLEARGMFPDAEANKIELKRLFAAATHDELSSRRRITSLTRLRKDFASLKNYNEGLVLMELARSYLFLDAPEALVTAEEAYDLFKNGVMMPTSTTKAKALVQRILKAKR